MPKSPAIPSSWNFHTAVGGCRTIKTGELELASYAKAEPQRAPLPSMARPSDVRAGLRFLNARLAAIPNAVRTSPTVDYYGSHPFEQVEHRVTLLCPSA
eukprot:502166-Amphidinium_carterae.1